MAKQALIEHRPWLLASIVCATGFYFLRDNPIGEGVWGYVLKGGSVLLLALYVALRTPKDENRYDGMLLMGALLFASAGDVAIELDLFVGALFFAAAHCVAIILFLKNRHGRPSAVQKLMSMALLLGTPITSYLLSGRLEVGIYGCFLGAMASAAWMSHYPRYRVGTGAVLFVMSDWLIFSQMGALDLATLPDILIWPLYYAGQVMIATGIVQCLRGEQPVR
ncbi:lysoplasmalogenase family protein [Erythrobacter sp. R86502]|uniref:lysoplasmalogenase family protein n=1 Tax=Erythrobacter sp. R86502 TaxID=3093846 RepID=UPI0036D418B7